MEPSSTTLWHLLSQAGWTMVPLYACSLVALTVFLRKLAQFQLGRIGGGRRALSEVEACRRDDLPWLVRSWREERAPLPRVLAATGAELLEHPERAEGTAERAASLELDRFDAWLPVLAFIAQVAPLFGLLGTVLGMVDLFSSMEVAGSAVSTTTLSAGIWKALLTTAAGLMVAIPALGAHLWLTRRVDRLQRRLERGVGVLLERAS